MEPKPGDWSCGSRRKFYAFTRLSYGLYCFSVPKLTNSISFETFEATVQSTTVGRTNFWLPPVLMPRFPVVAAASSEVTPDDAKPAVSSEVTPDSAKPAEKKPNFMEHLFRSHDQIRSMNIEGKSMFAPIEGETGWDRLRTMYSKDQLGNLGPEWQHIIQGLYISIFTGIAAGFFIGGRNAADRFVARNEATKFHNEMAARRALQDKMTLGMASHSMRWGWRLAAFTGIYLFTATNMSVYRGRSSALDYMIAGGVTGTVWRFLQGPRAMLVAGTLGSVLGLLAGAFSLTILRAAGMSMEEMRYWHYQANVMQQGEVIGKKLPKFPSAAEVKPAESDKVSSSSGVITGKA